MTLIDSFGRTITYLRASVTDRCSFRCVYCMPEHGASVVERHGLLTDEELLRILAVAVDLGIRKIRITGGEPLVRPGLPALLRRLTSQRTIDDLSITTNGQALAQVAPLLRDAGVNRINVSLDTLREDRFQRIARRGDLASVLAGIDAAEAVGMSPIKINCVVMRGWNEDEVADLAALSIDKDRHVRFIELMPVNWSVGDSVADSRTFAAAAARPGMITLFPDMESASFSRGFQTFESQAGDMLDGAALDAAFVPTSETRSEIERLLGQLEPAEVMTNGPARSYRLPGAIGTVGFISQITNDMCRDCNRIRLTPDGNIRPCLMADGEVYLRDAMRAGASDADIGDLIRLAVRHKPLEHRIEDGLRPTSRTMSQIGG